MNRKNIQRVIDHLKDLPDADSFDMHDIHCCLVAHAAMAFGFGLYDYTKSAIGRALGVPEDAIRAMYFAHADEHLLSWEADADEAVTFLEGVLDGRIIFNGLCWTEAAK